MSLFNTADGNFSEWKKCDRFLLTFFVAYFVIQAVPLDWKFYRNLFSIDWLHFNFYDLFRLTKYYPTFFGLEGFSNWVVAALLALIGSALWIYRDRKNINYDLVYYWLRVILRYRLGLGLIAYGLIKIFPLQMPYPSLGNLHTNYGDFLPWKIYFHTLGVAQGYEIFVGLLEAIAGGLLLFRRTTTLGAAIILGFTGNVFAANFAYDAGEQIYSAYLLVIALFLFAYDAPRLYRLLIQGKYTYANRFRPSFDEKTLRTLRIILKSGTAFFIVVLSITTYANFIRDPYKIPSTPGLPGAYGFYNVRDFKFNNQLIPYTTTDSNRWQNVVFEKWATLSIKSAREVKIDLNTGDEYHANDIDRNFESAGAAGRLYYSYATDTVNNVLLLRNKNKNHSNETYKLNFSIPNDSTIIVQGSSEKGDSIYAVLDKVKKNYLLYEGRRKRQKL